MKETGHGSTLQEISFNPYHHQFGPSPLETLPEEDGDTGEECENFENGGVSPLIGDYIWSQPQLTSHDLSEGDLKIQPTIRHEIERQRAKVLLLESTIGQLQEELRESKDQNELLEFRLLELGHIESPVSQQNSRDECRRKNSVDSEEGVEGLDELGSPTSQASSSLYEAEVSSAEVTNNEERSNGHASVAEARSSCSDCSESLSFQESGIFESQFSDDSYGIRQCGIRQIQDDLGAELTHLVTQLEQLISQGDDPVGREQRSKVKSPKTTTDPDLSYEFLICRQRIQEFERKLRKHGNFDYVQSLETKISLLLSESQKLEEEKAEIEEAENDSRNLCQRYEEKLKRTKQKKRNLEQELCCEREFIQNFMQNSEEREDELSNQIICLETKVQNQEQQNFDLEESNLELKDSITFLLHSIPILLAWILWKGQQGQNRRSRRILPSSQKFPSLQNSLLHQNDSHYLQNHLESHALPNESASSTNRVQSQELPADYFVPVNQESNDLSNKSAAADNCPEFQNLPADYFLYENRFEHVNSLTDFPLSKNRPPSLPPTAESRHLSITSQTESIKGRIGTDFSKNDTDLSNRGTDYVDSRACLHRNPGDFPGNGSDLPQIQADFSRNEVDFSRNDPYNEPDFPRNEPDFLRNDADFSRYEADFHRNGDDLPGRGADTSRSEADFSQDSSKPCLLCQILPKNIDLTEVGIQTLPEFLSDPGDKYFGRNFPMELGLKPISRQKYLTLHEDWDALIKALDDFEVERSSGKNSNETVSRVLTSGPKLRQGTLVANRIRSLFPDQMPPKCHDPSSPKGHEPSFIIHHEDESSNSKILVITSKIQQKVNEILLKGSRGQKIKLLPGDCCDLEGSTGSRGHENDEIQHLRAENNRLRGLFDEEEGSWSRVGKLEDENAQLRGALTTAVDLRNKLDEARSTSQRLMNRVEELEQSELSWKEKFTVEEKKEKNHLERISSLRAENEFLTSRFHLLQDELEVKGQRHNTFRQEIQNLQSEVKESLALIQGKEELFSRSEKEYQEKISKLEVALAEAQIELGELECSNGMLREEVLYFEKTVAEVTERADESEKLVQILTSKVDVLEKGNGELKKEVAEARQGRPDLSTSNDLEAFAKNEGGLKGVCWHVKDAMASIEKCSLCKSVAGPKLSEVSEQLNTLTYMLEGSQAQGHHSNLSLSRCESEEHLSPSLMGSNLTKWNSGMSPGQRRCHLEENKALKLNIALLEAELLKKDDDLRRMSEKQKVQSSQLKGLDEIRLRREKDLRESHLNESWWWKLRCDEKNELIQILARRIAHLSASDILGGGFVLEGILREIRNVGGSYPGNGSSHGPQGAEDIPLDTNSLLTYFETEKSRIREILESIQDPYAVSTLSSAMDFRVLRRIGDDALLVSWCADPTFGGYEISVNGNTYLKVPKEARCRALLFGLNTAEPLQLSLKVEGVRGHHETSITYIP